MKARALIALTFLASAAIAAEPAAPPAPSATPAPQNELPPAPREPEPQKVPGPGPIDPAPPSTPDPPKLPPARTISGTVTSVESSPHRVVVDATDGPVAIALDRNTAIYLNTGWGTVRDVRAGEQVRAGISGTENRALWLEVLSSTAEAEKADSGAITPPSVPPGEMSVPAGPGPGGSTGVPPPGPATPGTGPGR